MKNLLLKGFTVFVFLSFVQPVWACPWCRVQVKSGIYDEGFVGNLLVLLLPIFILIAIGFGLYHAGKISNKFRGRIK